MAQQITITHPYLGTRTYHYASPIQPAYAVRQCRQWAIENGYCGAIVRAVGA